MASTPTPDLGDYYIALALLHGCEFYRSDTGQWFINGEGGLVDLHPLERCQLEGSYRGDWGWRSREDLARDYCEWFKLL